MNKKFMLFLKNSLLLLGLLLLPGTGWAQFIFTTNSGMMSTLTLSGYTGSGGNVVIPGSTNGMFVVSISNAFNNCYTLINVTIPSSVTNIDDSAFYGCIRLTNVNFALPATVTSIGSNAFSSCYFLTNITLPDSVTSIGYDAFYRCYALTNIIIPGNVTNIGSYAFGSCTNLASATLPNSLTSIGNDAFYNCYALTNISLPGSVTHVSDGMFYQCTNLASVTLANGITHISSLAFYQCYGLTNISLPASLTSISNTVFGYCYGLTSITIPANVTRIDNYAFEYCTNLTHVYFQGNVPTPSDNTTVFWGTSPDITAYYLTGTTGWDSLPNGKFDGIPVAVYGSLPTPPALGIGSYGANHLPFVYYPLSGTNFTLQYTTNLASTNWQSISGFISTFVSGYVTNGTTVNGYVITNGYPAAFFRLK